MPSGDVGHCVGEVVRPDGGIVCRYVNNSVPSSLRRGTLSGKDNGIISQLGVWQKQRQQRRNHQGTALPTLENESSRAPWYAPFETPFLLLHYLTSALRSFSGSPLGRRGNDTSKVLLFRAYNYAKKLSRHLSDRGPIFGLW